MFQHFLCIKVKGKKPNLNKEIKKIQKDYVGASYFKVKGKGKLCFTYLAKSAKLIRKEEKEIGKPFKLR